MYITKWGITWQSLIRINWNFGTKKQNRFSHSSLKILVLRLIFSVPDHLLYSHQKGPGTDYLWLTSNILPLPIAYHLGLSMYKVLLDSDKHFLSYSTLTNPLEPNVHHMTSQILSILTDFYPDFCTIFSIIFQSLNLYNFGTRKDIKKL